MSALVLLVLAAGFAPPVLHAAGAPESAAIIEGRISEEISRLIPQIDHVGGEGVDTTASSSAPPVNPAPPPKQFRPLYRRLHGSPGLRVEWVTDPAATESPVTKSDLPEYQALAAAGNRRAMTLLGMRYHLGAGGLKQDYRRAYDWYAKAMDLDDGDAINNLGVLYREGLGVKKAPKIAYLIFLSVYKWKIGSTEAQERAARNIQQLVQELPKPEIHEALSYTWAYVGQVMKSRGTDWEPKPSVLPSGKRPRIRDNDWWLDAERAEMDFSSPAPWDKVNND